jgi:hypothetical protein
MMRSSTVLLLLALPLAGCFDLDRLLVHLDQSALADGGPNDGADGADAGPIAGCASHLGDGTWTMVSVGVVAPITSIWASPTGTDVIIPKGLSFYRSVDNGGTFPDTAKLTPANWGPVVWGIDSERVFFLSPVGGNTHLFSIDTTSSPAGVTSTDVTTALNAGTFTFVTGDAESVLFAGAGSMGMGAAEVWDNGHMSLSQLYTGFSAVRGIAAGNAQFYLMGFEYLSQSTDGGMTWSPIYTETMSNALYTAIRDVAGTSVDYAPTFTQAWNGLLPSNQEMLVTLLTSGNNLSDLICWDRDTLWTCQKSSSSGSHLNAVWGTDCGVILAVGDGFEALRYDNGSNKFMTETQTPPTIVSTDSFDFITGRNDGSAIVVTDNGVLYSRD